MPGTHARLSASGAKRWMTCTPSVALEEQFSESTSTYAEEGTFAHTLAELVINYNLGNIKKAAFNKELAKLKENEYYNQELQDYVDEYVNQVWEFINEAKASCKDVLVLTEQRLDFSEYVEDGFGTGDIVIIADGQLHIIDLKYGKGVGVSAEENPQLMLYGLGAIAAYEMLYDIQSIKMTIVQPRLENTSSYEVYVEDLEDWGINVVRPKAAFAMAGEGEFVVGDHCKFCRARKTCRARADYNLELAKFEFTDPNLLNDSEIGEILHKAEQLANWVKDITEYALEEAINGKKFDGWKLVEGRSNRKYVDEVKVADTLKDAGYDEAALYKKELYGITAMEKLVGKKKFTELLNDLIEKPQGKPTLVVESDRRPELSSVQSAQDDFAEEDNEFEECMDELSVLEAIPPYRPLNEYLKEWKDKYKENTIKKAYKLVCK